MRTLRPGRLQLSSVNRRGFRITAVWPVGEGPPGLFLQQLEAGRLQLRVASTSRQQFVTGDQRGAHFLRIRFFHAVACF